jgi:hypothetical protein
MKKDGIQTRNRKLTTKNRRKKPSQADMNNLLFTNDMFGKMGGAQAAAAAAGAQGLPFDINSQVCTSGAHTYSLC